MMYFSLLVDYYSINIVHNCLVKDEKVRKDSYGVSMILAIVENYCSTQ